MAMKYLGETLDIHAGGFDHLSVHHPNEIAQSEAVTGKPLANIWLHGNFITVGGAKLSKSLGNSYTLHDITGKGFDPLALRLLFLQSHYRSQADFSWDALQAAQRRLADLRTLADLRWQATGSDDDESLPFDQYGQAILSALKNDLNTPAALAAASEAAQAIQQQGISSKQLSSFNIFLELFDQFFGLKLTSSTDITNKQKKLIAQRQTARRDKDFTASDKLRAELYAQGISLRDTATSQIWFRI